MIAPLPPLPRRPPLMPCGWFVAGSWLADDLGCMWAQEIAEAFLAEIGIRDAPVSVAPDGERPGGDRSFSFWILPDDTTSYVHPDGKIEWYGTQWGDGMEEP